jgi:hypothetical protein
MFNHQTNIEDNVFMNFIYELLNLNITSLHYCHLLDKYDLLLFQHFLLANLLITSWLASASAF